MSCQCLRTIIIIIMFFKWNHSRKIWHKGLQLKGPMFLLLSKLRLREMACPSFSDKLWTGLGLECRFHYSQPHVISALSLSSFPRLPVATNSLSFTVVPCTCALSPQIEWVVLKITLLNSLIKKIQSSTLENLIGFITWLMNQAPPHLASRGKLRRWERL